MRQARKRKSRRVRNLDWDGLDKADPAPGEEADWIVWERKKGGREDVRCVM